MMEMQHEFDRRFTELWRQLQHCGIDPTTIGPLRTVSVNFPLRFAGLDLVPARDTPFERWIDQEIGP